MEFLNKAKRHLSWEWYQLHVITRVFLWDSMKSRSLKSILNASCLHLERFSPALQSDDPIFSNPDIQAHLNMEREEYLYRVQGKIVVEPEFGYVILKPFTIIDLALPGSQMVRDPKARQFFSGVPSFRSVMKGQPVVKVPSVITFHFVFDSNYYHFYMDVMTRLKLLDDYGIDQNIPILVSARLASQPFFQQITQSGSLSKRKWIVQDGFFLETEEIIFAKCDVGCRESLDFFLDSFDGAQVVTSQSRRLFLTRNAQVGRNIVNMDQLQPILDRFGFEVIDAGEMTVEEQMTIFSQAGCVIGIHGAALTNIVYRRNGSLKLLEIFLPEEAPLFYYLLAKTYDFEYDYILGTASQNKTRHAPFCVDPSLLESKLVKMFQTAP